MASKERGGRGQTAGIPRLSRGYPRAEAMLRTAFPPFFPFAASYFYFLKYIN
jgi:hypothetical protein